MNRRNFLKRCSILPFAGGLAVVAKTGASDPMVWLRTEEEYLEARTKKITERYGSSPVADVLLEIEKYNVWCALKLNPEYKDIPGAEEWLKECEDMMNTPEMKQRFDEEFRKILPI